MSEFHEAIARELAPLIAELRCDDCSHSVVPSEGEIATYLEEGWPICHGFTMRLVGRERGRREAIP